MNFRNLILGILLVCLVTVVFAPVSGRDSRGKSDYNIHYIPSNVPEKEIPIIKEIDLPAKELIPYSADTGEESEQESDVCKDSDGSNPNNAGYVEYYTLINGVKYNKNTLNDSCSYADLSVVYESVCVGDMWEYKIIPCPEGEKCQGGKCATVP